MKRNNTGFSLIELIIVVAILAVLIGIIAPQFIQYVNKSKRAVDVNNANEIVKALQIEEIFGAKSGMINDYDTFAFYWNKP